MTEWRALLDGAEAAEALRVAGMVADELAEPTPATRQHAHELALLHAFASAAGVSANGHERARRFVTQATDRLREDVLSPSLLDGFCGVGWVLSHLDALEDGDEDPLAPLDDAVAALVARRPWTGEFDLVSGLVGLGVYALERAAQPMANAIASAIIETLRQIARRDERGARWWTAPELLHPARRAEHPAGYYDLGVAHGTAGVIGFLARAPKSAPALELLDDAVRWLMSCADGDRRPRFVCWIDGGVPASLLRSAWCYGDCGVAVALLAAAKARGRPDWQRYALTLAHEAPRAGDDAAGVHDAAVCHGAAGVAHLYNRMYQASGDESLRAIALEWLRRALTMPLPASPGLLLGRCGVALTLLAAASELPPSWDALLLASVA
ncbi:MAG: Lanthionine biosynthesis cyclase LanC [bacterium]|nr:Lanthionine biosynthesis cyclase LanC [bacterium]